MIKGKPFVKWAGGKRQIIDKLKSFVPEQFNTYYEPFVGGGALLFELSPKNAVINDYNKELINENRQLKNKIIDKDFETDVKLRNMQNQVKKYEKYIKKVPKEILDEIEAKEREREHNKEKEMEL